VSFAAINLCVASQQMVFVVYFVICSVRKLLDTHSYDCSVDLLSSKVYLWEEEEEEEE
jgi:hypothetical protein